VYHAEMIQGPGGSKYHKLCFRCTDCDKSVDSTNSCVTSENVLLCKTCYSKKHGPVGFGCGPKSILDVYTICSRRISFPGFAGRWQVKLKAKHDHFEALLSASCPAANKGEFQRLYKYTYEISIVKCKVDLWRPLVMKTISKTAFGIQWLVISQKLH